MNDPPEVNPYASPTYSDPGPSYVSPISTSAYQGTIRSFRLMMHIVGGIWIAYAVLLGLALLAFLSMAMNDMLFLAIIVAIGAVWFSLGVATCFKQIWAVYIGLVLSYLSAIGNLLQVNICALILVVPPIIMAHIAIVRAGELKRARIPLTTKPGSLATGGQELFENPNFDFLDQGK